MARNNPDQPKKRKYGPPSRGGPGTLVGVRIQKTDLAAIDAWAEANRCSRQEALRQLAKRGLLGDRGRAT